jgi:hypothetical protein
MDNASSGPASSGKPLRLLQAVPNKLYKRLIVRYPYETDRDYAFFYHEAAHRLASTYKGEPIDDTILIPFLMLYRQAFELKLKNFVRYLASIRRRYHDPTNSELDFEAIKKRIRGELGHNLAKLLNELLKHYESLDLPEEFPEGTKRLVLMMHDADNRGTAFSYAGEMPESQDLADFPDLVEMLDEEFRLLSALEDWVDAIYSAAPEPDDF